uniref:Uncharacterized protein n=1 Tax=Aegilops tauschii subsp. strangulata TaxID=200361 RepID=A0A452XEV7_AEGTS
LPPLTPSLSVTNHTPFLASSSTIQYQATKRNSAEEISSADDGAATERRGDGGCGPSAAAPAGVQAGAEARAQRGLQLRLLLLHHLRAHGRHGHVQHGAEVRRAGVHDAGVAGGDGVQRLRGAVHGGDLLRVPDLRRALLLERQARRQGVGASRLMGHRLVQHRGTAHPGDRPARHRRGQRRRLPGLQVRRAGHLRHHPRPAWPHQQPPHPLALLVRQARRLLERRRYLSAGDPDPGSCQGEGERRVHLHALQHGQRHGDPQQGLYYGGGVADEPVLRSRLRRICTYDRRNEGRRQKRADRYHQRGGSLVHLRVDLPGGPHVGGDRHTVPAEPRQRRRRQRHRPGSLHHLSREVRQRHRSGGLPRGHRRCHVPLRHRVHHQQLENGLRLLPGRGDAVLECVAPGEQARGAAEHGLAFRRRGICHGPHVVGEPGGIPGDGIHRDHRVVHLLRAAHLLPGDDSPKVVHTGAVSSRPVRARRRMGGGPLGGLCHRALLFAGGVPGGKGRLQLHTSGRWGCVAAQHRGLGAPCTVLVPRTHHKR